MSSSQSDETTSSTKTIRNFLYVDEDQVNSLASQIFGGVAETITHSEGSERQRRSEQKGSLGSGKSTSREDKESRRRSERRVMYDRVYTRLEESLSNTITTPPDLHHETVHTKLESGSFICIQGNTFLEDHEMLGRIFNKWTDIADALVAAQVFQQFGFSGEQQLQDLRSEVQRLIEHTDDAQEEASLKARLESLPTSIDAVVAELQEELGMHQQEEWIEQHLLLFNNLFHGQSASFTLLRGLDEGVSFNAPINETHLRIDRDRIRTMHKGAEIGRWTLVGRVTSVPNRYDDGGAEIEPGGESEHMRDHFRGMIGPVEDVFQSMYQSENVAEVTLSPLAVYQERVVEASAD